MREILIWIVAWCVSGFVVIVLFHIGKLTTRLTECEARMDALAADIEAVLPTEEP